MTSRLERLAVDVAVGSAAYQRPMTTTAERVAIPAEMVGAFCVFAAQTADAFIRFGGATVDVAQAADSTLAAEALTEAATTAMLHVPAGQERRRRLRSTWTHAAIVGSASGTIRFGSTQGPA